MRYFFVYNATWLLIQKSCKIKLILLKVDLFFMNAIISTRAAQWYCIINDIDDDHCTVDIVW